MGTVIVMIALLGASSAANAHLGHGHAPAPEATAKVNVSAELDAASESEPDRVTELGAKAAAPFGLPSKQRCMGGCCSGASGHACCGFNLPAGMGCPVPTGMAHGFGEPSLRDGLAPEALRKPPRSFA